MAIATAPSAAPALLTARMVLLRMEWLRTKFLPIAMVDHHGHPAYVE
ncbi:hypothetical protein [Melissospora conviva]